MEKLNYQEALAWIHSIGRFGMNQGLQRIKKLLSYLGDPHKKLNFLHIGGTNGKGSTAAFAAAVLEAAGYRVGLYTSPYLEKFTNRMAINGQDITPERLVELVKKVKPFVEEIAADPLCGHPTEFEVVTALALTYFAQESPDIVVLEVGLGGRLDATNIIKKPLVSVITGISLEHTAILGNTIEEIAREKAGIIKEKTPVVTGVQDRAALAEIEKISKEKNCSFININEKYTYELKESTLEGQTFSLKHRGKGVEASQQEFIPEGEYRTKMIGGFQVRNAVLALEVVRLLQEEFPVKEEALRQGLLKAYLPGRLDILRKNPLLLVDGAHNSEGMENLVSSILSLKEAGVLNKQGRLYLVLAMLDDKDLSMILKHLKPLGEFNLIISENSNERVLSANIIKKEAALTGFKGKIIKPLAEAVKRTLEDARAEDLICVLGSLYNVAEVKAALE